MLFRLAFARKTIAVCLAGFVSSAGLVPALPSPAEAAEILRAARMNPLGQSIGLEARLRGPKGSTPFRIEVAEGLVRYEFQAPAQTLELELGAEESRLSERVGSPDAAARQVRPARFDDGVRGTGITYEDLALQFLYWRNPAIIGEETIKTRPAWKFEIQAPRTRSQYGVARLWIDKGSGALMRMEGYDPRGKLRRRFEVLSVQKLDGQWMLKQMRVETLDPDTRKILDRTYLEILGTDAAGGEGTSDTPARDTP
jgi:hypothetical protein